MSRKAEWSSPFTQNVTCRLIQPEACDQAEILIVALHGMGQNSLVMSKKLHALDNGKRAFLVPDGPLPFEKKVSNNRRQEGRAWYIYTGDQESFLASARHSGSWLKEQINQAKSAIGQPDIPVVLLGYSQGGYLGSILVFDHPGEFAGMVSCCSRMKTEILGDSKPEPIPVLVIHGDADPALPVQAAKDSADDLTSRGWPVDFRSWPEAEHAMIAEQWQAIDQWLSEVAQ